jgi:hypothetical protein
MRSEAITGVATAMMPKISPCISVCEPAARQNDRAPAIPIVAIIKETMVMREGKVKR